MAEGAPSRPAARANSQWLVTQLKSDGTLENPLGGALPDHGLMIDVLYAMYASGAGDLAAPIASYLELHATDYYTWDGLVPGQGFDQIIVGGATAKILVAAEVAGRDPRNFGGHDMVAETQGTIKRAGPDKGRVSDYAKNPDMADFVSNNANMFGQALGVIGLAGAGVNDQFAIDTMLTQQCSEGYFRIFFGYVPTTETGDHVTPNGYKVSTCDEGKAFDQSSPDGDSTGFALSALLAARRAGAQGLDEPIGRAVAWLTANQTADGGWGGGVGTEVANTNSTGLIVQALADAGGAQAAVDCGVAFLQSAQATTAADATTSLADHIGAIAYNPESYRAAQTGGITGIDTWIRASAQASLGLSQVGFYDLTQGNLPEDDPPPGDNPPPGPGGTTPPPQAGPTPQVSKKAGQPAPPKKKSNTQTVRPATTTSAPADDTPPGRLGAYLAGTLVDGDHVEVTEDDTTYVDYDATADLVLALRTLDEQPDAVDRASRFLLNPDSVKAYAHGVPYETKPAAYAQPLAKLLVIAEFLRADGDAPEDIDETVDMLRRDLAKLGKDGRFVDTGEFGDADDSTARLAWATLGTIAGSGEADRSIDTLVAHQCDDGTFPVSLDKVDCETGDVTATAAVVEALNGRRQVTQPTTGVHDARGIDDPRSAAPNNVVPKSWSDSRAAALVRTAAALNDATDTDGLVLDKRGTPDLPASAAVAAGRQAAGLDSSGTARSMAALLLDDGGFAAKDDEDSDLATSIAAAPGIAGRSWLSAELAPVTAAVRLPLASEHKNTDKNADTGGVARLGSHEVTPWKAAAFLSLLAAIAIGFGARYFFNRHRTNKGESST
ncbi:hypothetical protein [Actinophytocola oryzae]|uniref:hypothetical protein n=1 Tax=Actinophytocola oryzae TaxID=502181 RepID=UPI001062CE8A|nr:hypothetical protein [Actinophytocola oryzae]